jgi:SAM-dependent methyltransferase
LTPDRSVAAYRDFTYPLNVFMHILLQEEAHVDYLHYGIFEDPAQSLLAAQERSTELLFERLPPVPSRLLEVGIGLGTALNKLVRLGYRATGISPDASQIALARQRYGDDLPVACSRLEDFQAPHRFDAVIFQESSQYIPDLQLFRRAGQFLDFGGRVIVLDEFSAVPLDDPRALHSLESFKSAAHDAGFQILEELDLTERAAPTIDYFTERLPRFRLSLTGELGITSAQVDELIQSGRRYRTRYGDGTYVYRLLHLARESDR